MKKVAIVNRTNLKNYGSVLQVYALCEAVSNLGYDSEIIWEEGNVSKNYDFRLNKIFSTGLKLLTHPHLMKSTFSNVKYVQQHVISDKTVLMFDDFVKSNIKRRFYPAKLMNKGKVGEMYDKFVCGSDQVWCTTTTYIDPLMYLRFVSQEKRIAYAPSLGRDYIPNYNVKQMRRYINEIPNVSVREYTGKRLIKELTGRDVLVTVDPTLLLPKDKWDEIKVEPVISEKYILCYFLSTPTKDTQLKLFDYIKKTDKKVIALNSKLAYIEEHIKVLYPDCGPCEFIGYISKADCVLTDSYHGMLFSIICHKQFWSIEREYGEFDQSSRQLSVLRMLDISNRYCCLENPITFDKIDFSGIDESLREKINESMEYLKVALEN
ncbi:MAG: polysaccharide pyruvyl transferase family protein [Lachnospiraceae bacterium]|nr:polysaccharide pyruvyl transferase family protein [Lachnospiraceae bacterium]